MKLTKETRDRVKIGTILKDTCAKYRVTNMWVSSNGRARWVTILCLEDYVPNHKWLEGKCLYGEPLSNLYGMEIEEE